MDSRQKGLIVELNRHFEDHPSVEEQLATLTIHLTYLLQDVKELKQKTEEWATLQREQNGNVARLKDRMNEHDKYHGPLDENIANRIQKIEQERQEEREKKLFEDGIEEGKSEVKVELAEKDKFRFGVFVTLVGLSCTVLGFLLNNMDNIIDFLKEL